MAAGGAAPRWYEARLSGVDPADNLLEQDDQAWAALGAAGEPKVLLVSPGNTFLERALAAQGGLRAFRAAPADWPGVAAGQSGAANSAAAGSPRGASRSGVVRE